MQLTLVNAVISGVAITEGRKDGSREAGDYNLDPFNVRADPAKKVRSICTQMHS